MKLRCYNTTDLSFCRFIPDETEFDQEPQSVATDVPAGYNAPKYNVSL